MDADSSSKFIGSLTKFLQSLCNGYVEFQRGVELVGHIYLSIDTGEKVDYILHEKVNKSDENSVTFVSNSFHALPPKTEKERDKIQAPKHGFKSSASKDTSDDDDIMIVDNKGVPGSTNLGTIPSRGLKRTASPGSDQRASQWKPGSANLTRGPGSNIGASLNRRGPVSTVTSHDSEQHDISMGDMKLEQISADELLSLASQVGEGASSSGPGRGPVRVRRSSSLGDAAGQPVWIKQEAPDESLGGSDTGWTHGRDGQSDSSNSGSNLYPVMMHQSPAAFTSGPVFPGFPSTSISHHGISPGTSASSYGNPMTGTSGIDPADAVTQLGEELQRVCEAVLRVRSRELTLRKAAQIYGIPRSTLSDRVTGHVKLFAKRIKRYKKSAVRNVPMAAIENEAVSLEHNNVTEVVKRYTDEETLQNENAPEVYIENAEDGF